MGIEKETIVKAPIAENSFKSISSSFESSSITSDPDKFDEN